MVNKNDEERTRRVRQMFARIAHRYDLLNRIMTFGQDLRWRKEAIDRLQLHSNDRVLDLGTGTGDLALEISKRFPRTHTIGVDFTSQMIRRAQSRTNGANIEWIIADAARLPFRETAFNAVVSAFVLRNVTDIDQVLAEQCRILKPMGRIVSLETSPSITGWLRPITSFYLQRIVPLLGRIFSGDSEAYHHLPHSTQTFLPAEALARRMHKSDFQSVRYVRHMFGNVCIHWANKPQKRM